MELEDQEFSQIPELGENLEDVIVSGSPGIIKSALGKLAKVAGSASKGALGKIKSAARGARGVIRGLFESTHPTLGSRVSNYVDYGEKIAKAKGAASQLPDVPNIGDVSMLDRLRSISLPSISLPPARTVGMKVLKYGLPAALLAALVTGVGYAIYKGVSYSKEKKAAKEARDRAVSIFMKTVGRSAPTLFSSRPDQADRVEKVARDIVDNSRSEQEATEALTTLMNQVIGLERRLVPNPFTFGYQGRPVGGRLMTPIRA